IQVWLQDVSTDGGPSFDQNYDRAIADLVSVTEGTKEMRFVEVGVEKPFDDNERKMLILGLFYLANNENTYFSFNVYPNALYPDSVRGKDHPEKFTWFESIGYDIGGAVPNHWSPPDYRGETNSH